MKETFGLHRYQFTKGKWALLGAAAIMVGLGLTLSWKGSTGSSAAPGTLGMSAQKSTTSPSPFGNSFAESRPTTPSTQPTATAPATEGVGSPEFSAFLVKGGFGAFIGFAIGFAIRSFLRLAVVMIGFYLLTLTILSYLGWVEIHWDVIQNQFNHSITTLGQQFSSFKAFLTGAIPSSGMAAVGLSIGLRKR